MPSSVLEQPIRQALPRAAGIQRSTYLDILRTLAMLSIITLHCGTNVMHQQNGTVWWSAAVFTATVLRWGTPVFVMISGVLLLGSQKEESAGAFLGGRLRRIVVPAACWAVLYMLVGEVLLKKHAVSVGQVLQNLLTGHVQPHLWFVYMIVGLYLLTPVLRTYVRAASEENLRYFLWVWFLANLVPPYLEKFAGLPLGFAGYLEMTNYVGYFVLGYYLHHTTQNARTVRLYCLAGLLGTVVSVGGTYWLSARHQQLDEFFAYRLRANVILMAAGLFVLVKHLPWHRWLSAGVRRGVVYVSGLSFGMYLAHLMVAAALRKGVAGLSASEHQLLGHSVPLWVGIPAVATLTALVAFGLAATLQRIPYLRRLAL